MNELELLEFNYFNMLTIRKKKSSSIKSDNKPSSIEDQLIRPPYMRQRQPLTNEQFNNDQSSQVECESHTCAITC